MDTWKVHKNYEFEGPLRRTREVASKMSQGIRKAVEDIFDKGDFLEIRPSPQHSCAKRSRTPQRGHWGSLGSALKGRWKGRGGLCDNYWRGNLSWEVEGFLQCLNQKLQDSLSPRTIFWHSLIRRPSRRVGIILGVSPKTSSRRARPRDIPKLFFNHKLTPGGPLGLFQWWNIHSWTWGIRW